MPKIKIKTVQYFTFYCPACKDYHQVTDEWEINSDMNKPTIRPSVLVTRIDENPITKMWDIESQRCHSFITDGYIQYLSDCKHDLAGQTIELPEMP
jgi:hypothetical protein